MKMPWKRLMIGGFVLVTVATVGWALAHRGQKPPEIVSEAVARRTISQTVEATGVVEPATTVALSFEVGGVMITLPVKVGDVVVEGQILASLDARELTADLENAQKAVAVAEANLAQKKAGAADEAVLVSDAGVRVAEAARAAAQVAVTNAETDRARQAALATATVAQADTSRRSAQDALESTRSTNTQLLTTSLQDYATELSGAMIAVRSGLSEADEVLGVDNSLANDGFERVLSSLDAQALQAALNAYEEAKRSRDAAEALVFALANPPAATAVSTAAARTITALQDAAQTLLETRRALDATSIDTQEFSFSDLSAVKSVIDASRADVQAALSGVRAGAQAYASALITTRSDERMAQNALSEAERAYETALAETSSRTANADATLATNRAQLAVREADLAQARASATQTTASPRAVDLLALAREVERARAVLEAASARLTKAELRSPINGTVTAVEAEVGETAAVGRSVVTVQTVDERYRIAADISEADIAQVRVGNLVDVTLDAFGEAVVFPATVTRIDPAEKTIEGVVFYEVEMDFNDMPVGLKPGMSANTTIHTREVANALSVPQRAILGSNGARIVRILRADQTIEERSVQVGVRGDDGYVEITDGVQEGELVVLSIKTAE